MNQGFQVKEGNAACNEMLSAGQVHRKEQEVSGGENVITGVSFIVTVYNWKEHLSRKKQPGILVDKIQETLSPFANLLADKGGLIAFR
jgi:hypothetical protein